MPFFLSPLEVTSTASMDKSRESQERGITLDLGFSSFSTDAPEHIQSAGYDAIQWCLVDCPGHASLIRTVIGWEAFKASGFWTRALYRYFIDLLPFI